MGSKKKTKPVKVDTKEHLQLMQEQLDDLQSRVFELEAGHKPFTSEYYEDLRLL